MKNAMALNGHRLGLPLRPMDGSNGMPPGGMPFPFAPQGFGAPFMPYYPCPNPSSGGMLPNPAEFFGLPHLIMQQQLLRMAAAAQNIQNRTTSGNSPLQASTPPGNSSAGTPNSTPTSSDVKPSPTSSKRGFDVNDLLK